MHDHTHAVTHSDHDYMTMGHKAMEALVQERVMEQLRKTHAQEIEQLATHVADLVGAHLGDMHLTS